MQIGDEIIITVPQPELTVVTVEQTTYEEEYYGEVEYVYNDAWYTTKSVVLREEEPGYHEITALVTKHNGTEESRETIHEEVIREPVCKKVEVGTQTPPTYIKPLSGGRQTSGYGRRRAPTKGASTNHRAIDWATPTGTAIWASSGGTVSLAGWQSGYGYVVYINHPDGNQTGGSGFSQEDRSLPQRPYPEQRSLRPCTKPSPKPASGSLHQTDR